MFRSFFYSLVIFLFSTSTYANYQSNLDIESFKEKWLNHIEHEDVAGVDCPDYIEPTITFNAGSMYCEEDDTRSTICEENQEQYEQEKEDVDNFVEILAELSSTYLKDPTPSPYLTTCFVKHVDHWAKNNALGAYPQPTNQGEYIRFRTLTRVSELYLMFEDEINRCDWCLTKTPRIFRWFKTLADGTISHFIAKADADSASANHRYWGGLASLNVGIITGDSKYFDWARESFMVGIYQIENDGSLPLEMKRGDMALAYHFYAAAPLIAMQDKFRANNISSSFERDQLNKLINFSHQSYHRMINSPLAKSKYIDKVNYCSYALSELEVHLKRNSSIEKNDSADLQAIFLETGRNQCNDSGLLYSTGLGGEVSIMHGIVNLDYVINQ
ncbi:Polysaccharide lyase [Thalassocella blandensis]|nr:Polysaccharide lyase [Thalassocella blandensis]